MDKVAWTIDVFLIVLEAESPSSRCWQIWFIVRPLFLTCRWPSSCHILNGLFLSCVWGGGSQGDWAFRTLNLYNLGLSPRPHLTLINLEGPSSNIVTLEIGTSTCEFWGNTNTRSITDTFLLSVRKYGVETMLQLDCLGSNPSYGTSELHDCGKVSFSFCIWKIRIILLSNIVLPVCQVLL